MNKQQLRVNMKRMRRAKRITQAKLAELCGMSLGAVSGIEQGKREVSRETLELFCHVLNWPIEELLRNCE